MKPGALAAKVQAFDDEALGALAVPLYGRSADDTERELQQAALAELGRRSHATCVEPEARPARRAKS